MKGDVGRWVLVIVGLLIIAFAQLGMKTRPRRPRRTMKPRQRRSPAEVTYDCLVDASVRYAAKLTSAERDMIGEVCQALWEIAEGQR